jgi:hypothetical protein
LTQIIWIRPASWARTVWIGGLDIAYSTFNPPPADQIARCLADKAAQQREDWAAMGGFLADAVVGSTTELMTTRTALSRLEALWRDRRRFRAGSSALGALAIRPRYPVVTIRRLAEFLNVSFPAASKAIRQLCDIGILQERTGYSRNQIFSAPEALYRS